MIESFVNRVALSHGMKTITTLFVLSIVTTASIAQSSGPVTTDMKVSPDPTGGVTKVTVDAVVSLPVTAEKTTFDFTRSFREFTGTDKSGAAKAASSQVIEAGNAFIAASVDSRGEYMATTGDGEALLYSGTWDFTGSTIIRIDGVSYKFGEYPGIWTNPLAAYDGEISGVWNVAGVDVVVTYVPVFSPISEKEDALLVRYRLENVSSGDREIGFFKMLDIEAGGNDSAPVWVMNDHSRNEREYQRENMPNFWQVFADGPDQQTDALIVEGVLDSGPSTCPDRFVVGDWGRLIQITWDYTPVGQYNDSAVGMWWYPETVSPGVSKTVATMIGPGSPVTAGTDLVLRVTSLKKVSVKNREIRPGCIQVSAVVINTTSILANDVEFEIVHGDKLELDEEMSQIIRVGHLKPGEWRHVVWTLIADKSGFASQDYVNVVARTSRTDISGVVLESFITIPESVDYYISAAEVFVGDDPGEGSGTVMTAVDSDFNGETERVVASVDISGLPYGEQTLSIRGRDSNGVWGDVETKQFTHSPPALQELEIDADIALIRSQKQDTLHGIGPFERIGFAVYISGNVSMRSFILDIDWNSSKAEMKSSSGANIPDDDRDINGVEGLIYAEEKNILVQDGGQMSKIEMADEPGHYRVNWAKLGGEPASSAQGLLYYAEFKTTESFTPDTEFAVTVSASLFDDLGKETAVTPAVFKIEPSVAYAPPENVEVHDVPDDHGHKLELTWTASSDEHLLDYYNIYRSRNPKLTKVVSIDTLATINDLIEFETAYTIRMDQVSAGTRYYLDNTVPLNNVLYYYWIESVGPDGVSEKTAAMNPVCVAEIPVEFEVSPPSPNPFNPSMTISYRLASQSRITAVMYDLLGRKVKTLADSERQAGYHSITWDGRDEQGLTVGAGVYIYSIQAGNVRKTGKVTFQK